MEVLEYGYVKSGKVYRKSFLEFEDREIGEVKESDEASLQYYGDRFSLAQAKVGEVEAKINATENKGSYLMKVLHLKETLHEFDALGDFESLYKKLDLLEEQLSGFIRQNRIKNLEIKTALIAELTEATKGNEWKSATADVKEVQRKWIKTGAVEDAEKERVEGTFKAILDDFFTRRGEFYADLEKMMVEKEADYQAFLKKAETLESLESYAALVGKIREYKEEWKGLGRIKRESRDAYWQKFQDIVTAALSKAKKDKKTKGKTDKAENTKLRVAFLEELETINLNIVPKGNVKELRNKWKFLGPVSKKEMDELQPKFLFLIDQIAEKQFIESLVLKKAKGKASEAEKEKIRVRVVYDLLNRDKNELHVFNENLGKFNTSSGLDRLIGDKFELQERKVKVKEAILNQIKRKS